MEPAKTIITITPHDEPGRWSVHVLAEGIFSEEAQRTYGYVAQSEQLLLERVLEAVTIAVEHESRSKALGFG